MVRTARLLAPLALAISCAAPASAGPLDDAGSSFVRVAEYTINTSAVTHVTEYNDRVTIWFTGRESTIHFDTLPDRQAVRRWLDAQTAEFPRVGTHYMRLAKVTHTKAGGQGLEVNFEGGNRFTLRNAQEIEVLNNLLVPKKG